MMHRNPVIIAVTESPQFRQIDCLTFYLDRSSGIRVAITRRIFLQQLKQALYHLEIGKTTLLQRIEKDFREQLMPELIKDAGRLPVVRIEAIAADSGNFGQRDYLMRLMNALGEPESLINRKFIPDQPDTKRSKKMSPATRSIQATADQAQVHYSTIARLEHGRVLQMPTLARLARWLNIPFERIVTGGNSKESPIGYYPQEFILELEMQVNNRFQDDQILREKMSAAMLVSPPPTLRQIAENLGCKSLLLKRLCPDLCDELKERRKTCLKESLGALEEKLKVALTEDPPPPLNAIYLRSGVKHYSHIQRRFPNLSEAIMQRRREYKKKCRKEAKLELETALIEVPPPSAKEIARRVKCTHTWLSRNFPDLYSQVRANYSEHKSQCTQELKEKRARSMR